MHLHAETEDGFAVSSILVRWNGNNAIEKTRKGKQVASDERRNRDMSLNSQKSALLKY